MILGQETVARIVQIIAGLGIVYSLFELKSEGMILAYPKTLKVISKFC